MTDKQILAEVYKMVSNGYVADIQDDVVRFIEQEWQKEDDRVNIAMYNRNRPVKDHVTHICQITRRKDDR